MSAMSLNRRLLNGRRPPSACVEPSSVCVVQSRSNNDSGNLYTEECYVRDMEWRRGSRPDEGKSDIQSIQSIRWSRTHAWLRFEGSIPSQVAQKSSPVCEMISADDPDCHSHSLTTCLASCVMSRAWSLIFMNMSERLTGWSRPLLFMKIMSFMCFRSLRSSRSERYPARIVCCVQTQLRSAPSQQNVQNTQSTQNTQNAQSPV